MSVSPATPDAIAPVSKRRAWLNALLITLLGCLLLGLGCFVVLGHYLPRRMTLFHAAVVQQLGFALAFAVIFVVIGRMATRSGAVVGRSRLAQAHQ
jgi:hypothetical protein